RCRPRRLLHGVHALRHRLDHRPPARADRRPARAADRRQPAPRAASPAARAAARAHHAGGGPAMSGRPAVDPLPHLTAVAAALADAEQPAATFAALDAALGRVLGHKLFTILRWHADRRESERLYTNQPAAYPVGGRKSLNPTAWSRQVLEERRPYIGR